jgi:hypothetical protein
MIDAYLHAANFFSIEVVLDLSYDVSIGSLMDENL